MSVQNPYQFQSSSFSETRNVRPGVPHELHRPQPMRLSPERQPQNSEITRHLGRSTAVFASAVPPRGLSGVLRRAAYRIEDHHASHWMTLMLADRIDALERRAPNLLRFGAIILLGALATRALRNRRARHLSEPTTTQRGRDRNTEWYDQDEGEHRSYVR